MPKVTFKNNQLVTQVESGCSILQAAAKVGARVGDACGGNCACSTCHVWVVDGLDSLSDMEEAEDDRLDQAFDVRAESRLACQAIVGEEDVVVEITEESLKAWLDEHPEQRNAAKAG